MTYLEELLAIKKKANDIIDTEVINLFRDFQKKAPVDTGSFKSAWEINKKENNWNISNSMEYATILFDGRRIVAGKMQGSEQWSEGGQVMLEQFDIDLQNKLERL